MQVQKTKQGYKVVKSLFGKYEEIPVNWEVKRLSEVGKITGGGTPDTTNTEYWSGDIPWAAPTDIINLSTKFIDSTERYISKNGVDSSSAKLIPKGSILITSRATIGYCAINTRPMATNQGFQSLICDNGYHNLFMLYAINFHRKKLLRLSYGTTFLEISKSNIKEVSFPCPPFQEQQKIALIISKVDELIQKTDQVIE